MGRKVSVVIPFYNKWGLTHQLLFDLYTYNRDAIYEILLVDNGSTDDDVFGGMKWWRGLFGMENSAQLRYVKIEENIGFLKAANFGMQEARGEILILISNDVRVPCSFVKDVARILEVPRTIVGGKLLDYDTGWNKFYEKLFPYLEGWLLACRKEDWTKLQGFDERYAPCDYEDVDFSTKALNDKYGLTPLNNPKIVHLGAQTIGYNPAREANTKLNKIKFEAKWLKSTSP